MKYLSFVALLLLVPAAVFAQETGFVPLTNIPFVFETGSAFNLTSFLNGLYRLCIGAAAVIAVLQIMRAGIIYMGGDSVTEKKEAKNLIALSIGGLILVLSPVIVFSVINPEILTLKIGNLEKLGTQIKSGDVVAGSPWESTASNARQLCLDQGGTPTEPTPGTIRCTPKTTSGETCTTFPVGVSTVSSAKQQTCCSNQNSCSLNALPKGQYQCICEAPAGTLSTSCSAFAPIQATYSSQTCDYTSGFQQISNTCCIATSGTGATTGKCCGKPTTGADTSQYGPPFAYGIWYETIETINGKESVCAKNDSQTFTTYESCTTAYDARIQTVTSRTNPKTNKSYLYAVSKACNEKKSHQPEPFHIFSGDMQNVPLCSGSLKW